MLHDTALGYRTELAGLGFAASPLYIWSAPSAFIQPHGTKLPQAGRESGFRTWRSAILLEPARPLVYLIDQLLGPTATQNY